MRKSNRKELILGLLAEHPDAPARTLARLLHEQYPLEFATVESARSSVRYYLGASGETKRKQAKKAKSDTHHRKPRNAGEFKIPKGVRQQAKSRRFSDAGRWLVLSDLHVPYHDERAVEAAVKYGLERNCEHVCINGDLIDFATISRWERDVRLRDADEEIETAREVIHEIGRHFAGRKVYKIGNHDERLQTFLVKRAPELLGIKEFELPRLLEIEGSGPTQWDIVDSKQFYRIGKLPMFHGHELPKGGYDPVNVGRGVFLRVAEPCVVGHWHRTSTHVETSGMKTHITTCYSTGCLCDLSPLYAPINKWNHGFAIVDVASNGDWQVWNRTIDRGLVYATE